MVKEIIKNKKQILIILIFIIAISIRVIKWPNLIYDVNVDEAMLAINARSIAYTGRDMYGTSFPIYFESWLVGGQSAFPTYLVAICIKLFGYSMFSIRLPILIFSIISIFIIYKLAQKMFNEKVAIVTLFLTAINPWQILQSQWLLDCNIFPHVLLIAIYLLFVGLEEKKNNYLYSSMIFFALSMYCYGISLYFVPVFLFLICTYVIIKKDIKIKQILICFFIYILISLPIIIMYIINFYNLETINIFGLTIQKFNYFMRKQDMLLFSKNIPEQLKLNAKILRNIIILQDDKLPWNQMPGFGTIYHVSLIFIISGMFFFIYLTKLKREKKYTIIIYIWLAVSIFVGLIINEANINRMNCLWYVFIIMNAYGIYNIIYFEKMKKTILVSIISFYLIYFGIFSYKFYTEFPNKVADEGVFSNGLVDACEYINNTDEKNIVLSNLVNCDRAGNTYLSDLN